MPKKNSLNKKFDKRKLQDRNFMEILKMFAPGTSLRVGLDDIRKMKKGALIVFESERLSEIFEPGFRVNSKFSSQKLAELAKMDGAIILSKDLKKILYANAFLFPSVKISTKETGTRHKTAERTAKQLETITIAVSERKNKITIYYKDFKYELENSSEILRRAAETLQILEKQKELLENLIINLNVSEITNMVTREEVCDILQKIEVIRRIAESVKKYLVELGSEGIIVSMRLRELTKDLNNQRKMILKDYFNLNFSKIDIILKRINFDKLLEPSEISKVLFDELNNEFICPKGIRILNEANVAEESIRLILNNFENLEGILNAGTESLMKVFNDEDFVNSLKQKIENIGEKILARKKI